MKKKLVFIIMQLCTVASFSQIQVKQLLCENTINPIGLGVTNPQFSWQLVAELRNTMQTAYEIRVGENEIDLYPSWLYPVKMGATTIWERWDGQKPDSTFQSVGMNSFNHYAYGAIGDWMYRVLAGIDTENSETGVG